MIAAGLAQVEHALGRRFDDDDQPLLLSVTLVAPGSSDTILYVGLNKRTVTGLARLACGDERFAFAAYCRLIRSVGEFVFSIPLSAFDQALEKLGVGDLAECSTAKLRRAVNVFLKVFAEYSGDIFPEDPLQQLRQIVTTAMKAQGPTAAVDVEAMVFGNFRPISGSGVLTTRNLATGGPEPVCLYASNRIGTDALNISSAVVPVEDAYQLPRGLQEQLKVIAAAVEASHRDVCDIEFIVENSKLWILQVQPAIRSPAAAFTLASQFLNSGVIDVREALSRVTGTQLQQLMFPAIEASADISEISRGLGVSPGAASGRIAFTAARTIDMASCGQDVILVRQNTDPDDVPGMLRANGVLTSAGGTTSHAAVIGRAIGKPCVCGVDLEIDPIARRFVTNGQVFSEGDLISIDGSRGMIYAGAATVTRSEVIRYFEGITTDSESPLVSAVVNLMNAADRFRRLEVRANADSPEDAARARRFGADGIGLCRTEHFFLGDRRQLIEQLLLAPRPYCPASTLEALHEAQRKDLVGILTEMSGMPVTIRLIDPPMHEFLPGVEEAASSGSAERLAAVRRITEQNPMLGTRGVRLGLTIPDLLATQVTAIAEAAAQVKNAGGDPRVEILVPMISTREEMAAVRARILEVIDDILGQGSLGISVSIGAMIEIPRAAVVADEIVEFADFLSLGTNDLTQMVWALSRDDAEHSWLRRYQELGVLDSSPFESIDRAGVGQFIETALSAGRRRRPGLPVGVCGEHGGEPQSVHYFHETGMDYVSCSPYRVPVARLEAARAVILGESETR